MSVKPYYQDSCITLYCGDSREIIPKIKGQYDVVITDPPWPVKGKVDIVGTDRPWELLAEVSGSIDPSCKRLMFVFGDQSDPRIMKAIPEHFPFLRVCLMRRIPPPRRGTVLGLGDIVYVFGGTHLVDNGKKLMVGMCEIPSNKFDLKRNRESGHPCPRNIKGMQWLIGRYALTTDCILDPFAGAGTTLIAARYGGRQCIGIEIEERWCEVIAREMRQGVIEDEMA